MRVCYPKLLAVLLSFAGFTATAQQKPFPQAVSYPNCIKPNHVTQASMNASVASYYDYWKSQYLKNNLSSLPGGYYIKGEITGDEEGFTPLGSSEGQGYGMVIVALMAGHDPNARAIYDGLYKTFRAYHSSVNSNLMGWVVADDKNAQGHFDSATDGDMDIAYSLILAHYQWGSSGSINYLAEAKKVINNGLKANNVSNSNRLNLSDAESKTSLNTRPSDWMMDHMRAFYQETGDVTWTNVINNLYTVYNTFITKYSSGTGLISDFVVKNPPEPCPQDFLHEYKYTNEYNYNACRVPLRIVMDYAMYGSTPAYIICTKLVTWVKTKTGDDPTKIKAGYQLNGTARNTYSDGVFTAPFVAASVISSNNQSFLNKGWDYMKSTKSDYYSDSYNLMCQLFVSGNWWIPGQSVPGNTPPAVNITSPANNASFAAPASIAISAAATDSDGTIGKVEFFNGSTKLGEATASPYTYNWNNVAAGTYTVTAKATDNGNASTTSAAVTITVTGTTACDPVTASGDDGNVAANAIDNNLSTRWSASGEQWIQFCLGSAQQVNGVDIAFYKGDTRKASFDILAGNDGQNWTTVAAGIQSSGSGVNFESFPFTAVTAKYIRIAGHGNNVNAWNSYTEVKIKTAAVSKMSAVDKNTATGMDITISPNPFSSQAVITCRLEKAGITRMTLYNVTGQPAGILINGPMAAGTHRIPLNGDRYLPGVYIIRLEQNGRVITRRIVRE